MNKGFTVCGVKVSAEARSMMAFGGYSIDASDSCVAFVRKCAKYPNMHVVVSLSPGASSSIDVALESHDFDTWSIGGMSSGSVKGRTRWTYWSDGDDMSSDALSYGSQSAALAAALYLAARV